MADELKRLLDNPDFVALYNDGMSMLFRSGIFNYLRWFGRPRMIDMGANPNIMATQAARSAGFNEALDLLLYFKELATPSQEDIRSKVVPDYGGGDFAKEHGFLTDEELNAVRSGTTPDYSKHFRKTDA